MAQPTAAPAMEMEVIVEGGIHRTIHELGWGGMEVLDPAASTVWEPPIYLVWDRLVTLDIETGRAVPALAASWQTNADATQWTFDLRTGVTHSDGTPFTAADVAYTTARHLDPNIGSGFRAELEIVDPDMIETPDDHTIVYNLRSANVDFPSLLASRYFRMVPDGSGESLKDNPIGTGAFTVDSAEPDGISVFTARSDYWDSTPLLGRVTFASIADHDAQINATLAGQVDIAGVITSLTASQASLFEGDPEFYLQESPRGQIQELIMITTEPPFDDVRVRQALKLVVDPNEMIAVVGQGSGFPACNSPAWPTDPYYLPQDCPQDIERARELLAEAGFPDGLTVEIETSNLTPMMIPMATVYKEQAALAGITVEISQAPADGYWSSTWMVHPFSSSYYTIKPLDQFLSVTFRCGAAWNETFWCSEEQDMLQDQARATLDFDERKELCQETQRIIAEEGGMIAPFFSNFIRAVNVRLQGLPQLAIFSDYPYHQFRIVEP